MAKKPVEKTLGQIKGDIKKGQESAEEIEKTYVEAIKKPRPIISGVDFVIILVCLVMLAFSIEERSRVISLISGVALLLMVAKVIFSNMGGK